MNGKKINVRMLSMADVIKGQGVSSAYNEQVNLVKQSKILNIKVNEKFKDADITHHHTVDPKNYFTMFNKGTIHVAYVHMLAEKLEGSIKLNKVFYKIFQKYTHSFYKKADYLVIVNPDTQKLLLTYGIDKSKITYIPNYVSDEDFYVLSDEKQIYMKNKYDFDKDKFTVLSVGQVLLGKGVRDFIQSAKDNPDIDYVWAGGFSFGQLTDGYDELKSYVDNPPKNVRFIGIVDREKMNEVYNAADVLFMPSLNEMFPMTILEAINTEIPIVIRNLELYKHILFDKYEECNDISDFNKEILRLKNDKEHFTLSKQRSIELKEFYTRSYVLKLWEDFYKKIYLENKGE